MDGGTLTEEEIERLGLALLLTTQDQASSSALSTKPGRWG